MLLAAGEICFDSEMHLKETKSMIWKTRKIKQLTM